MFSFESICFRRQIHHCRVNGGSKRNEIDLFLNENLPQSVSVFPISFVYKTGIVKSNFSSVGPSSERNIVFLSDERPTLESLDFTIHIGSTPTFLYFDLYLNTAYAAHYVYFKTYSSSF